ncbi:hypothetical protein [Anoxybacillus sp. CHMUD]|uniref:hypothetical protein n=1 Tax=Anoxybacillus sp. CHMUD TaxID=2508870 RepID=UPI001492EE97|nr:hypothetical protein [Anoxybacillus sp. CHMUD]NNU91337.1 hypothetical protein [Anoxybacillus sp. CHMUD]
MKKWIILLIAAFVFGLTGCNNQAEDKQEETKQTEQNMEQSNAADVFIERNEIMKVKRILLLILGLAFYYQPS